MVVLVMWQTDPQMMLDVRGWWRPMWVHTTVLKALKLFTHVNDTFSCGGNVPFDTQPSFFPLLKTSDVFSSPSPAWLLYWPLTTEHSSSRSLRSLLVVQPTIKGDESIHADSDSEDEHADGNQHDYFWLSFSLRLLTHTHAHPDTQAMVHK